VRKVVVLRRLMQLPLSSNDDFSWCCWNRLDKSFLLMRRMVATSLSCGFSNLFSLFFSSFSSLIPLVFMLGFFSSSFQRRKGAAFFPNIYKSIVKVCYFHPKHLIVSKPKQFPKLKCETMNFPIIK